MKNKRYLCIFLILTLIFCFFSCGNGDVSDEELIERTSTLLSKSKVFNDLLFENGIPISEVEPENGYYFADLSELQAKGFSSVSSIRDKIRDVWTEAFCQRMEKTAIFSAVYTTSAVGSYAYCYDYYDEHGNVLGVKVSVDGLPTKTDHVEYILDSIRVVGKAKATAELKVDVLVTNFADETQSQTLKVKLEKDMDGEWRLSSYTCAAFHYDSYPIH